MRQSLETGAPAIKVLRRKIVSPQQVKALMAGEIDLGMGVLLGQEDATQPRIRLTMAEDDAGLIEQAGSATVITG